jgi:hypothetical protein
MQTSSVQSAPCVSPEAANEMLSGLLLQAGHNQTIEVLSTDVQAIDGMWVATAFFKISPNDPDDIGEDTLEVGERERDLTETDSAGFLYLSSARAEQEEEREFSPAQAIPEAEMPDANLADFQTDFDPLIYPDPNQAPVGGNDENFTVGAGEELDRTINVAEDLQKEFEAAEFAENVDSVAYLPDGASYDPEATFEERREAEEEALELLEEEELERLRRLAVPLSIADVPLEAPELENKA